jgi:hypothetical protein
MRQAEELTERLRAAIEAMAAGQTAGIETAAPVH